MPLKALRSPIKSWIFLADWSNAHYSHITCDIIQLIISSAPNIDLDWWYKSLKKCIIRNCIPKERYLYRGHSHYKFFIELVLIAVGSKKMARFTFLLHHLMGNWIFTSTDAKGNEQTDDRLEDSHCTQSADRRHKLYAWQYCKTVVYKREKNESMNIKG